MIEGRDEGAPRQEAALFRALWRVSSWHQELADKLVKRFEVKRKAIAMKNPRYAEIQSRRGEDGAILLSEELSFDDWTEQLEIESKIKAPWYVGVAEWLSKAELLGALKRYILRRRRARNLLAGGIDEQEWWGLNFSLCLRLAKQLDALAEGMNSWPGVERGYASPEEWASTLRSKAKNLRRYSGSSEEEAAMEVWCNLKFEGADEAIVAAAGVEHDRIETEDRLAAKSALIWVAENLDLLSD